MFETVETVYVGLGARDDDVGIGSFSQGYKAVFLESHRHFALCIHSSADGGDRKAHQGGGGADHLGDGVEGRIDGAHAESCALCFLVSDTQFDRGGGHGHGAAHHIQVLELVGVRHTKDLFGHEDLDVFVQDFLPFIGEIFELQEEPVEFVGGEFVAELCELVLECVSSGVLAEHQEIPGTGPPSGVP